MLLCVFQFQFHAFISFGWCATSFYLSLRDWSKKLYPARDESLFLFSSRYCTCIFSPLSSRTMCHIEPADTAATECSRQSDSNCCVLIAKLRMETWLDDCFRDTLKKIIIPCWLCPVTSCRRHFTTNAPSGVCVCLELRFHSDTHW